METETRTTDKKMSMPKAVTRTFRALGTANTIFVPKCEDKSAIDAAADRIKKLDDLLSVFKEGSEISRINANAGIDFTEVSADTMQLLKRAVCFSEMSDGAFDITAAPLVALWGIGKKQDRIPEAGEIGQARRLAGYGDIVFSGTENRVMLKRKGQRINLGGIAKGYAADEAKRILLQHGIRNALINLGGNVIAMGEKPDRSPWAVGIQDPLEDTGTAMGMLSLKDETAVTSGANEQYFIKDGVRYHHILDPRTGRPANSGLLSVTVVGDCSMDMDALTTAVFVLGMEKGVRLIEKMNAQAVFIGADRSVFVTKLLQNRFKLVDNNHASYNRGDNHGKP